MIYTCTMNPSLDYYMEFEKPLEKGVTNRSTLEYFEAGGKGVNVSIVLNNLLIPSRTLGFLGGFTKDFYISLLNKYEFLQPSFSYTPGHTRINIKMIGAEDTDINAAGPYVPPETMVSLKKKLNKIYSGDTFVMAGFCPAYLIDDAVEMIAELANDDVKIVIDSLPEIMKRSLPYKPFLLKPRVNEIEEMTGMTITDRESLIDACEVLVKEGAENVIVQLGREGSVMVNKDGAYYSDIIQSEQVINTVGSGDSMVAGFIMDALRSKDRVENFAFANCCKEATAFSKGLATREKVESLAKEVKVVKVR